MSLKYTVKIHYFSQLHWITYLVLIDKFCIGFFNPKRRDELFLQKMGNIYQIVILYKRIYCLILEIRKCYKFF